jgi:hypothetical protein
MAKTTVGILETRRDAKLRKLSKLGPVLQGSICRIGVKCGNPSCRCAGGEKHASNVLTRKERGKTKSVYVPSGMLEEAKKWTGEFRKAKKLLKEISDMGEKIMRMHVATERAKKRNLEGDRRKDRRK